MTPQHIWSWFVILSRIAAWILLRVFISNLAQ